MLLTDLPCDLTRRILGSVCVSRDFHLIVNARGTSTQWRDLVDAYIDQSEHGQRAKQYYSAICMSIQSDKARRKLFLHYTGSVCGIHCDKDYETCRYVCGICGVRLVSVAKLHTCVVGVDVLRMRRRRKVKKRLINMMTGQLLAIFFVSVLVVKIKQQRLVCYWG